MGEVILRSMNGGNGLHSYTKNSTTARKIIEAAKELIIKAVEDLDIKTLSSYCKTIRIADLGCSTGPNTFIAVQTIIDSLENKFCSDTNNIEFQVFFNDLASNDYNELFLTLPVERNYFIAGVPGSFHGPLFPKDSLHFVHSSSSVHWLSRVPEEVQDQNSPAWNKGRIYYSNSRDEVVRAYQAQFGKDMDNFLKFRAQEIVDGGLMALMIFCRPIGLSHSETYLNKGFEQVEDALIDMVKEGKISNEKLNSFNLPTYMASLEEVEAAVKRSQCFNVETLEILSQETPKPKVMSSVFRAILEGMIKDHFGDGILDELFGTVLKKLEDLSPFFKPFDEYVSLFVLLKCVKKIKK